MFAMFSMGNLGDSSGLTCNTINLAKESAKVDFQCYSGTLDRLVSFGINAGKAPACDVVGQKGGAAYLEAGEASWLDDSLSAYHDHSLNAAFSSNGGPYHESCSSFTSDDMMNSKFKENLVTNFKQMCKHK